MAKLSLEERINAPFEYENNLVEIETLKAKIAFLRERNEILKRNIEKDKDFHKKYCLNLKENCDGTY